MRRTSACRLPNLWRLLPFLVLAIAPASPAHAEEARLLRFPALHSGKVAFSHAGDLYLVPVEGGVARRLTSDPDSYEMFPRFSPDGKHLAFTGQYDGNTEVYVMPSEGGVPRRLTYTATLDRDDVSDRMGPNNIVMTWRDNDTVVYRSRRVEWNDFKGQLHLARLDGGVPEALPLPRGGWCSFSPDGRQMIYNQVFREFRTWKRYRGGQADDLWLHDFNTRETTRLTLDAGQDMFPMWRGNQVYFVSERDENRQANLYVLDLTSRTTRQLTRFTEFAVKFPSLGDTGIVFENGGYLHRLDLATEEVKRIPVEIREDFASGRGGMKDVSKAVTTFDLAPDGARLVLGARGEVFTVPAKYGATRNLTQTPGVHERDATWSPDGRWIAYLSDASGEDELWIRSQDGREAPRQLTTGGDSYKYAPRWSPDSKHLAWSDKLNRLRVVDVASTNVVLVSQSEAWEIHDFTWSPDSRWIAFVRPDPRRFGNIHVFNLENRSTIPVTDGWFEVRDPEFSSDGKYLFFISERSFEPLYGSTEWNHVYRNMERVYFVALAADAPSLLAPRSDEVKPRESADALRPPEKPPEAKPADRPLKSIKDLLEDPEFRKVVTALASGGTNAPVPATSTNAVPATNDVPVRVRVDADGLIQRIGVLPSGAANYGELKSVGKRLYYFRDSKLWAFDFEKEKETEIGDVSAFRVSADTKKMAVRTGETFAVVDLPTGKLDTKDSTVSLADLKVTLDRRAEWKQIYAECWRQMRDFFYAPNLHEVDWPAMRTRYEPLLEHVHHRADLTYIIGELIGELNAGHAYVGGGDYPRPERIPLGLLGAKLSRDPSGYYRIDRILPGHNWDPKYRSPLTEIGVNAKVGDYIVTIDGRSTRALPDIYAALVGKADRQVKLGLNTAASEEGAREVTVIPTADERDLYYLDWVLGNIRKVEAATAGKVGYVHVPDMGVPGLNEFAKFYYPQLHKEALIVDCRGNGGGNVSPQIIERLRREPAFWTIARNGAVAVDPSGQVLGPKVLLLDQFSASDGDIVAYRFRQHRLGPIIGQRSWGGVVGIRGSLPLLDGGMLNRPEFSRFDLGGKEWVMEGVGVSPDIEVINDPAREFAGDDDQLNRALEEIRKAMQERPVRIPPVPPYPDKRR